MKSLIILLSVLFTLNVFAQDSAIDKMNKQNDRNRITDTVQVNGSKDRMNVQVPLTSDSLRNTNSVNSPSRDTTTVTPPLEAKSKVENVWVKSGLWLALVVILAVIVVRRRKNAGK